MESSQQLRRGTGRLRSLGEHFFFFLIIERSRNSGVCAAPSPSALSLAGAFDVSPPAARLAVLAKFPGIQLLPPRRPARDPQLPPAPYPQACPITGFAPGRAPTWLAEALSPPGVSGAPGGVWVRGSP